MIITEPIKKIEQIDNLLDKYGFHLLMPDDCDTLEDIAERLIGAEWCRLYFSDLTYVKHFGSNAQHTLFITLGTTEKLFRLYGNQKIPFMVSHLDIWRARFQVNADYHIIGNPWRKDEGVNNLDRYLKEAERLVKTLVKKLNKISSYLEW